MLLQEETSEIIESLGRNEDMNSIQWEPIPTPTQAEMQEAAHLIIFPRRSQNWFSSYYLLQKATQTFHHAW